jgi:hypothetical protein
MRFSLGFIVGLLIGIAATAAYYELLGRDNRARRERRQRLTEAKS